MSKGEQRRSAILDSALALTSEAGLAGATIGALAERTGMSKSGLFAHFQSKENLEVAILQEAVRRFVGLVIVPALEQKRGEPRVRALFDRWMAWPKHDFQPGGCIFAAAASELDDRPGPARDVLVGAQKDWMGTLAQAAQIAVDEGHFRKDLDVRQFAFEEFALVYGAQIVHRLGLDPRPGQKLRAGFDRLVKDARS
ncbi:MAG TPA: TetR/AcrR family transcriptional regulator [Polyangiaceae bacterium]|nr:TetR/AcrR family transcriptional regulator [Polyangiaceae bacterium]